jgi:hypothetical protein
MEKQKALFNAKKTPILMKNEGNIGVVLLDKFKTSI